MGIQNGKGAMIPFITVFVVYWIYIMNSLPGLAVAPLLGDLNSVFPHASDLSIQMLNFIPSLLCIPFILFGGQLAAKYNNLMLLYIGNIVFFASGLLMLFSTELWQLILLSALLGAGSGIMLPLSQGFIGQLFYGKARTKQFGISLTITNVVLIGTNLFVGYMGETNWKLPFCVYLTPIVPLFLIPFLKKYVLVHPPKEVKGQPKINQYKNINIPVMIRYCLYIGLLQFLTMVLSIDMGFLVEEFHEKSGIAGDIISIGMLSIALAGLCVGFFVKILKKGILELCVLAIALGFTLITYAPNLWIVTIGLVFGMFFYGICNPYATDKASKAAMGPAAITITMMWVLLVVNIVSVVAPFIIAWVKKLFHEPSDYHQFAFLFMAVVAYASALMIFVRRIIVERKAKNNPVLATAPIANGTSTTVDATTTTTTTPASTSAPTGNVNSSSSESNTTNNESEKSS